MLTWHECENLSLNRFMELAIVDPEPAVFHDIEDIRVALPKTTVGMVIGLSGMNGLRRNNIISGHHHDERNLGCGEGARIEPVNPALLIEDMVESPAQRASRAPISHQPERV